MRRTDGRCWAGSRTGRTRGDREDPKRARSLHLSPADRTRLREAAAAAVKTNSEYVLDLIVADDTDCHLVVLKPDEQAEVLDGVREMREFLRAAKAGLVGSRLGLSEALRALSRGADG